MKLLKEQVKIPFCITNGICRTGCISYRTQVTVLFVNGMNINCANAFRSLWKIRLASRCQVVKLVDRYIKVSVVNNKLSMISQSSEQSNETIFIKTN